ncbi:MAG: hypothetical protein ACETV1_02605 [Candidatus Bathyarchaeia archaeon]
MAREVEFRRCIEATANVFFLTVMVNRSQLSFYGEEGSQINAGIMMWFDIGRGYCEKDAQVLDVEIRFLTASCKGGSISHHEHEFARLGDPPPRENNDYHVFTSAPTMLEDKEMNLIEIDLGHYLDKAFYLLERDLKVSLSSATLKHFSLFIEANYGYGALTIEKVECCFPPRIFSAYVLIPSLIYGFLTSISTLLLTTFIEKILRKRRNFTMRALQN